MKRGKREDRRIRARNQVWEANRTTMPLTNRLVELGSAGIY